MRRTVPDFERITSDWVVAPSVVVADPVEELAVGDPGGREEAVVAFDQVVGGQHRLDVVARLDGGRALGVVARPELPLHLATHRLERRCRDDPFRGPPDADQQIDAGVGPGGRDGPGHVAVGDQPDPGSGRPHRGDQPRRGGAGRG